MNRNTGQAIQGIDHLLQSVGDILSTLIGSRVMRREYGSLVPALLDHPDNATTQIRLYSAVTSALMRWEPRIEVKRITSRRDPERPGFVEFTLQGSYLSPLAPRPQPLTLTVPVSVRSAS